MKRAGLFFLFLVAANPCFARYSGGAGEPNDPYQIATAQDLNDIGNHIEDFNKCFVLTADVNMAGINGSEYRIIGPNSTTPFIGVFDGNNRTIYNFTCITNALYTGLFGWVDANGSIGNLKLVQPNIVASNSPVGALAGIVAGANISGCSVENGTVNGTSEVGGLIGRLFGDGMLSECYVKADVNGFRIVGGLVGSITRSYNFHASGCSADCNVTGLDFIGGFAGLINGGLIVNCVASGSVSGNEYIGGFVGSARLQYIPIPAESNPFIADCYSNSLVDGNNYVGGFTGQLINSISAVSNCTVTGQVNASGNYVGGFAGQNDANIFNCGVWTDVSGLDSVGGLVGATAPSPYSRIMASRFTGTVAGRWNVGGIVGLNQTSSPVFDYSVLSSYAVGQIIGDGNVGGLVGRQNSNSRVVSNSFSSCEISGTTNIGGLVGLSINFPPSNCVWDVEKSGLNNWYGYGPAYVFHSNRGRTTEQMKSAYSFAGWVCDANWLIEQGQNPPHLSWESNQGQPLLEVIFPNGSGTPGDPFQIYQPMQLVAMGWAQCLFNREFKLTNDLDFADFNLSDFRPVGLSQKEPPQPPLGFTGTFDGDGHFISDFNYVAKKDYGPEPFGCGLFGILDANSQIKNLGLIRPVITNYNSSPCGVLVGRFDSGTVSNCFSLGGNVTNFSADTGGLVGAITTANAGLFDSYSVTDVCNSYAGGLAGYNQGQIARCYSAGKIRDLPTCGGLVGEGSGGTVLDSFWDINTSGQHASAGGTGLTTEQMKTYSYFANANWDFNDVWHICETTNYPKLLWQMPVSDYRCPDGVDFIDYSFLAEHWLQTDYGDCDGLEVTGNGKVDFVEFSLLAGYWQQTGCGNCGGLDYSWDNKVDSDDLVILCQNWLATDYGDLEGAEITGDGIVDLEDLLLFSGQWLTGLSD